MNKLYTLLAFILLATTTWAQSPEKMSYQAVVRDSGDNLVSNQAVGMQISILQGSAAGTAVYVETHTPTTNVNGLVTLQIGTGTVVSGDISTIDWATDTYFIKTEIDPEGGSNYTIIGTSQLLSVPYALHAKTAESVTSTCGLAIGDTHQGGIIFYLDASGCHGLVAAPSDQSTAISWWNGSYVDTYAYGNGIGAGLGNSMGIRRWQGSCNSCYASELCQYLTLGGYTDWYLPSKYELNLMYENIGPGNALGLGNNFGNFANSFYWCSTEYDSAIAWGQFFPSGYELEYKENSGSVRAIRAF
ncbi:DUF1566 domain-containing protein [Kordia sp.]|uniref:DUF1566 domain-containing protein n=1 Tax=Kordia sp. TaxID=1965332 RepID=UPI0025BCCD8C|nr:DUF1566 domain-containing protein [Kordia sp.]MCH2195362.1 DUF1566 domain-containing protein [Kordia sp.]